MRNPQQQIPNPGQRILPAGQDRNINLLKNRVDGRFSAALTFASGVAGVLLVGAVLDPSVGTSLDFHSLISYQNTGETGAAYEFDVIGIEGAFTVGGGTPVPGVFYGDGTTNPFAGGTQTLLTKVNVQTVAAGAEDAITFAQLLQLPNPLLGPHVAIIVALSVTGGDLHLAGSEGVPVADTWMREMP